jgi:hypothetical protein
MSNPTTYICMYMCSIVGIILGNMMGRYNNKNMIPLTIVITSFTTPFIFTLIMDYILMIYFNKLFSSIVTISLTLLFTYFFKSKYIEFLQPGNINLRIINHPIINPPISYTQIDMETSYQCDRENYKYVHEKLKITKKNINNDISDCIICRGCEDNMLMLDCGHVYCTQCLLKWLYVKNGEDTCCYCFKNIDFKLATIIKESVVKEVCVIN